MGELISISNGDRLDTGAAVELDTSKLDNPDHVIYQDIQQTQEVFGASAAQADLDTAQMLLRLAGRFKQS